MPTTTSPLHHVGFIMDGNRRWAKAAGLPTLEGHRRGYEKLKEVARWCAELAIPQVTVYAFSTENWNREKNEVAYLMQLLERAIKNEVAEIQASGYAVKVIGSIDALSPALAEACHAVNSNQLQNSKGTLYLAINYGGRTEILDATRQLLRQAVPPETVTPELFSSILYAPEASSVDLVIRTGGEHRLSNFLLWQAAYAEIFVSDTHWPALTKDEFTSIISWYSNRQRRFGK
ncbi:MAG: polyprenyl diphosphate synthase [Patescibacteria group bacterium]